MTRAVAVTTVRNEGAFLLEWLAHHRAVGFCDFLVYSNDCDDGTGAMLDRLAALGVLLHVPNPGPYPRGPQWAALKAAAGHPLVMAADWIMGLDVDEFVTVRTGDGTLAALIAACPGATAIALTWRMFGNAGVVAIEDRPVAQTFTRAAPRVLHWPWRAVQIKTLFRRDGAFAKLGVHRPRAPRADRLGAERWFDGSGRPLPADFVTGPPFTPLGDDPYALAQINHYALGSMQGYLVKCDRGRANRQAEPFDLGYWIERNFSDVEDTDIAVMAPRSEPLRQAWLADPVLGPLHQAAVAWRQARFAALMATDERWRALYGRLLMTPPTRALSADEARTVWRHGATPR